jgi:hypothetical protein
VQVGICELIWGVDGIFKTIAELRLSDAFEFSILVIEKAEKHDFGRGYAAAPSCCPRLRETKGRLPEISIRRIEILNCTFNLKPLYQRYIQVRTVVGRMLWFVRWLSPR